MSLPLIVRRRAEHDMAEAGLWYESRSSGAGIHFIRCADAAISLIGRQPEAGPVQFGLFRRVLVSRFPFSVFYSIEPEAIVVHGVFHSSRDPDKIRRLLEVWQRRADMSPQAARLRCIRGEMGALLGEIARHCGSGRLFRSGIYFVFIA